MSVISLADVSASPASCPPPLSAQALAPQAAGQLAPMFKALGDPIRLRLLSLIASTSEICVCDLTDAFDVTGATVSHHLRVLRETGLVDCDRRGTWVYYWARPEALELLGGLFTTADPPHQDELISVQPDVSRLLADPLRAQIVDILAGGPACTSYLVAETGAKQPNVSGHLKQLRDAGVVVAQPRGRYTFYRLAPDALRGGARHLTDLAARAGANAGTFRT